jgi:hypothetical protein
MSSFIVRVPDERDGELKAVVLELIAPDTALEYHFIQVHAVAPASQGRITIEMVNP